MTDSNESDHSQHETGLPADEERDDNEDVIVSPVAAVSEGHCDHKEELPSAQEAVSPVPEMNRLGDDGEIDGDGEVSSVADLQEVEGEKDNERMMSVHSEQNSEDGEERDIETTGDGLLGNTKEDFSEKDFGNTDNLERENEHLRNTEESFLEENKEIETVANHIDRKIEKTICKIDQNITVDDSCRNSKEIQEIEHEVAFLSTDLEVNREIDIFVTESGPNQLSDEESGDPVDDKSDNESEPDLDAYQRDNNNELWHNDQERNVRLAQSAVPGRRQGSHTCPEERQIEKEIFVSEDDMSRENEKEITLPELKENIDNNNECNEEEINNTDSAYIQNDTESYSRCYEDSNNIQSDNYTADVTGNYSHDGTDANNTGIDDTDANNTGIDDTDANNTGIDDTDANNTGIDDTDANNTGIDDTEINGCDETEAQNNKTDSDETQTRSPKVNANSYCHHILDAHIHDTTKTDGNLETYSAEGSHAECVFEKTTDMDGMCDPDKCDTYNEIRSDEDFEVENNEGVNGEVTDETDDAKDESVTCKQGQGEEASDCWTREEFSSVGCEINLEVERNDDDDVVVIVEDCLHKVIEEMEKKTSMIGTGRDKSGIRNKKNGISKEQRKSKTEIGQEEAIRMSTLPLEDSQPIRTRRSLKRPPMKKLIKRSVSRPRPEEGHDSGVDESTQAKENGDVRPKGAVSKGSPKRRLPRPPEQVKRTTASSSSMHSVERKKLSMNKIEVGKTASPNLKQVKSKIGSMGNAAYKPGGGNVRIETTKKLDFTKAQSRIQAKNDGYSGPAGGEKKIETQKLKWSATSKVGSLENKDHKPAGGEKKIETQKIAFKEKAQSKVGSKDNMTHKAGGGDVQILEAKVDFRERASSRVRSLDNVKHRPGGGEKKIFDDKEYARQISRGISSPTSKGSSEGRASGAQSPTALSPTTPGQDAQD